MAKIMVICAFAESLLNFRQELLLSMQQKHEVIACAPDGSDELIRQLQQMGIGYRKIFIKRTGLNPLHDLYTLYFLKKLFVLEKPDIVFAYASKPVIFASLAAKLAKVPKMYSMITGLGSYFINTDFKAKFIQKILRLLYKIALPVNKKIFLQNQDDINVFLQLKIIKNEQQIVKIAGSGVNLAYFLPSAVNLQPITFLLIARLIKDKGILEFVAAARHIKLKHRHQQVQFQIAGWLEQKASSISQKMVDSWTQEGIIEYLGKLGDIRPALQQATVYVLPSYREGVPKTVLEAMACGRAIITTDAPGCKDTVLAEKNGFLVPIKNVAALIAAIEKFILDPKLAVTMGQYSRKLAETLFDVHKVNQCILQNMELL